MWFANPAGGGAWGGGKSGTAFLAAVQQPQVCVCVCGGGGDVTAVVMMSKGRYNSVAAVQKHLQHAAVHRFVSVVVVMVGVETGGWGLI